MLDMRPEYRDSRDAMQASRFDIVQREAEFPHGAHHCESGANTFQYTTSSYESYMRGASGEAIHNWRSSTTCLAMPGPCSVASKRDSWRRVTVQRKNQDRSQARGFTRIIDRTSSSRCGMRLPDVASRISLAGRAGGRAVKHHH
jgi:hypothetical protein